jgi:hypothetical protein
MKMIEVVNGDSEEFNLTPYIKLLKHELTEVAYNKSVENCLTNMALLDELFTLWQWCQVADHGGKPTIDAIKRDISSRGVLPWNPVPATRKSTLNTMNRVAKIDSRIGQLLRDFYELPMAKGPRNVSWLEKTTASRERLTEFWQYVRETWHMSETKLMEPYDFNTNMLSHMSFDISSGHLAKVEAERKQIEDDGRRERIPIAQHQRSDQFVQQPWDIGAGEDGVVRRKLPKKSNASRGDGLLEAELKGLDLDQAPAEQVDIPSLASTTMPQIAVKQDTLSLIAKMFPTGVDGTSGVRWTQLVQALTDAGMTATQSAGSAVAFSNRQGSISLHMPHPEPVVDAITLRGFGKRLNKWLGWSNETFMLRPKDSAVVQETAIE